ncbi:MAG: hypothetical protein ABIR98_02270 [Usitatibacter sp.]
MKTIRLAVAALAFAAAGAHAQGKTCTSSESAAAEKAMDRVVNWDLLYKTWQEFGYCDTALSEDVFTDALMRLAVEWKNVDQFARRYQGDPKFKTFVDKHVRSLTAKEDARSLYSRAKQSCPPKLDAFCAELAEVAKSAL